MPFPDYEATSVHFIKHISDHYRDRELLVFENSRLTYSDAEKQTAVLAKAMLSAGVSKGTRIGLLMPNSTDFLLTWLAATRIGGLVIPLNTFYKTKELKYVLHHADIEILFTVPKLLNNDYLERLEACAPSLKRAQPAPLLLPELPYLREIYVLGECDREWASSYSSLLENIHPSIDDHFLSQVESCVFPADPMVIIYSSGSTSDPKGAIHTHGAVIRHSYNLASVREIDFNDRCFSPMPFFWVGGLIYTLCCAMQKGACLITETNFNPEHTLSLLERERVTHVSGWPHYGKALVEHSKFKDTDLSAVRGGNIYAILPAACRPKDVELRSNGLGMTETCGPHSLGRMDIDLPESLRGSFGQALEGVSLKIIDIDSGKELPPEASGELCVRGYSLMQGLYKKEREKTFDPDGYYHTGDICHMNETGHLFFQARADDMIKSAGVSIIPREIEVLLESQREIHSAFVVGLPDETRGQNVAATIVFNDGYALDEDTISNRLKSELSSYKVPRQYFFMNLSQLPFTDSGKIDKRKLIQQLIKHEHMQTVNEGFKCHSP